MTAGLLMAFALLILGASMQAGRTQITRPPDTASGSTTVHVAKPTGVVDRDRASILEALKQVQPGGTIQFAPGTYMVGERIRVALPRLTLLGHAEGTTLRGCELLPYEQMWQEMVKRRAERRARPAPAAVVAPVIPCSGLLLIGGYGTVRNLTFEYMDVALQLGLGREGVTAGGYRIEGNTFRNSGSGVRADFLSPDPIVIRGNRFLNMFHAVMSSAGSLQVLENDISVPEPKRTRPPGRHPGGAIGFGGEHNVVAGNRIEGHPDGIRVIANALRPSTRHNVIRDNTITVRRVRFASSEDVVVKHELDSTVVGIPLALDNPNGEAILEDNLVEGNRIIGAEGLGIEIQHASRNRIVNNTIAGIKKRDPFPGNILGGDPQGWRTANGSGIWISSGSEENEIAGNTFERLAAYAIVLEGGRNRVETRRAEDTVRDIGKENRIRRASSRTPR